MSDIKTEDVLGSFWEGEEVSGLTCYALWPGSPQIEPLFPLQFWPKGTEVKRQRLQGASWTVLLWDLRVRQWPLDWMELLERVLRSFCEAGAVIAWCGLEGHFADPPSLFDPQEMSGGVYAYFAPALGFRCTASLGEAFKTIDDREMMKLHVFVQETLGGERS